MGRVPAWRRYLRFGGPNVRADVDDELSFHIETTAAEYVARGESLAHARQLAMQEFGNIGGARHRCYTIGERRRRRDARSELFDALGQDIRYALRVLRDTPAFTLGVACTIALAIAATTIAFGMLDRLTLRAPASLIGSRSVKRIYESNAFAPLPQYASAMSYQRYLDIRSQSRAFVDFAAQHQREVVIRTGRATDAARVAYVTASFWNLFDAVPLLGRFPFAIDEADGAKPAIAVVSYDYWKSRLHGDSDVVGSTFAIGDAAYRIVGVAPRGFSGIDRQAPAAFIPVVAGPPVLTQQKYGSTWFEVVARQRDDVSDARAHQDLRTAVRSSVAKQIALGASTLSTPKAEDAEAIAGPIQPELGPLRTPQAEVARWLFAVAAIVLLIAALNVANLMLGRMARRRREIAVRLALGISSTRLVRLLLVEAGMLVGAGTALGTVLVAWLGEPVRRIALPNSRLAAMELDSRAIAFITVCALFATATVTLAPALKSLGWNVVAALGTGASVMRRSRLRGASIVAQTAFSLALLICAGLFVRSLREVRAVPLGFEPRRVLVISTMNGSSTYPNVPASLAEHMGARLRAMKDVEAVATSGSLPFQMHMFRKFGAMDADTSGLTDEIAYSVVSADYFRVVGTRIIDGRAFNTSDDAAAPKVAVISAALARRLWPARKPIGQCLALNDDRTECVKVVGIAESSRQWSYRGDDMFAYYVPMAQARSAMSGTLLLRIRGDARASVDRIRRELQPEMPDGVQLRVTPLQDGLDVAAQSWHIGATTLPFLAAFALLLAGAGLYGVATHDLAERRKEVSLRVALGASAAQVVRANLRGVLGVAFAGIGAGVLLSVVTTPRIAGLLFGVSSRDPLTFIVACVVALATFVAAAAVPAFRAARADPAVVLRSG